MGDLMTERSHEDITKSILQVLEEYVNPAVAAHGGVINFISFDSGVVLVELSGACSGCAGSTATLKHGVENMLTQLVPEVEFVESIDDPFSEVDPFYTDPFGMHDWDLEEDDNDTSSK
jgi:Fe-S cluster biogenesis protein NfuA